MTGRTGKVRAVVVGETGLANAGFQVAAVLPRDHKLLLQIFLLARRREPWQKAFSLRVKKEFIFNPADGGQENLGRQRNGGRQFDRLPIRCHFCRLRQSLDT